MDAYDYWKTTPPEPTQRQVGACGHCDSEIYAGDTVLIDRVDGGYYCDEACFMAYMRKAGHVETDTVD
ncbi:hypothetical protein J2S07_001266 [Robertmurraya andreesenii]|uniref:TRASH domain-containing protein n=1 Tax=Anoxybacillus andreesenii TaxID=1325932 RepID=A0ABT9V1Y2_9BACL|nr:hypothetical protein [Robertmurraya andreesenii]